MACRQIIGLITNGGRRHNIKENLELMDKYAAKIRERHPEDWVYNPAEHQYYSHKDPEKLWRKYMVDCIENMVVEWKNGGIIIHALPNYKESKGAMFERDLAKRLGIEIIYEREL